MKKVLYSRGQLTGEQPHFAKSATMEFMKVDIQVCVEASSHTEWTSIMTLLWQQTHHLEWSNAGPRAYVALRAYWSEYANLVIWIH